MGDSSLLNPHKSLVACLALVHLHRAVRSHPLYEVLSAVFSLQDSASMVNEATMRRSRALIGTLLIGCHGLAMA